MKHKNIIVLDVFLFGNGNFAVFDNNGNQIPELQKNLFDLWRKKGYIISDEIKINGHGSI